MNTLFYNYWPPCWALAIYAVKTILDLVVLRHKLSPSMFGDRIKSFGVDLYWMGVMIWGAVLIKSDSNTLIYKYFDTRFQLRLLLIVLLFVGAIFITVLKRQEEKITNNNSTGIVRIGQNFLGCFLIGLMILIGLLNFSSVFYMMGSQ